MNKKTKQFSLRVPYALSVHGSEESRAVAKVIDEHRTGLGCETREFERKVAKLFEKKYGIMVNSGSSANLLVFEILQIPEKSEVITPVLTFTTTLSPILQKNLIPIFVDAVPGTYQIDIDQIEKKITKRTRALMIPSLLGNIPDWPRLQKIAKKHKLFLIEDSCDTLGATIRGKATGKFTDISTTSFYGSHIINGAGGGGMICVNSAKHRDRALMLRGWGRTSSLFADSEEFSKRFQHKLAGVPYDGKFIFSEVGYNFLPLEISSAFGLVQLKKFPGFTKARQKNYARLLKYFKKWERFFILPEQTPQTKTNWIAFPLTIRRNAPFSRIQIVKFLESENIQTRPVFSGNILRQPAYSNLKKLNKNKKFPVSDFIMKNSFLIGCHHGLTAQQLNKIERSFNTFLKNL